MPERSEPTAPSPAPTAAPPAAAPSPSIPPPVVAAATPVAATHGPRKPKPFEGAGSALARAVVGFATLIADLSGKMFQKAKVESTRFQARPEHVRWRAYAMGSYGVIVFATLLAQLYDANPLKAYVKYEHVSMPEVNLVFVRNDSDVTWKHVQITLNGLYHYVRADLAPGETANININRFYILDSKGGNQYPPPGYQGRSLTIQCDRGTYETKLQENQP